jgi:DNA-binding response OmpR family regulator
MDVRHTNQPGTDPSPSESVTALPDLTRMCDPPRTLLVVDDDPRVRDAAAQLLRMNGYTVLEAAGAAQALRLAREEAAIHLLITDFSMPEVDGYEPPRRFRLLHPETPVLMVSGSFPSFPGPVKSLERFDFLPKPFHCSELLQKIRTLLDHTVSLPAR